MAKETGIDALRKSEMMAHLLDSLEDGKDIGHYGRLVFAMIAHHFLPDEEIVKHLAQDKDFSPEEARVLVAQVREKNYNPPRREKILEFQAQQDFPILLNPENPDTGNVYRDLDFPEEVYEHISEYYEQKEKAGAAR